MVRGERWRLADIHAGERCAVLTLSGTSAANAHTRLRVIEPFDRAVAVDVDRLRLRKRRTVLRCALASVRGTRPAGALWTAADASIDLLPYQLEPALAVLRGATRLLLADAVGLGKTIQAALILAELRARGWVDRALVLCPAGLRATWAHELETRFHIPCAVIDQASIAEHAAALPPGVNPWSGHSTIVTSIDFVKRPEVLAALSGLPIDVLIADEAHHLTPGTDRAHAAARLASRAAWCVLASATPHSGDVAAFAFLSALGAHDDPLVVFRRTRREAGVGGSRRERLLRITPTDAERALHNAVDDYARAIWDGRGAIERPAQLVAMTIARRAASSTAALERTLQRRLSLLSTEPVAEQPPLPWVEDDEDDGDGDRAVLAAPGLANGVDEHAAIGALLELVAHCGPGAKLRRLQRLLARVAEPVIVFTEYRDTVEAILAIVPAGRRAAAITGATPLDDRRSAIDAFTRGNLDVLVATDTAGEGLNLQQRCRLVIDLELPWNPLRLEQRVGRVDRLGQARRVHAIHLVLNGSIEERVLDRLRERQRRATLPGAPVHELEMARAVFSTSPLACPDDPIVTASVGGATAEARRVAAARACSRDDAAAMWTGPRRSGRAPVIALHALECTGGRGTITARDVSASVIDVEWSSSTTRLQASMARSIADATGPRATAASRNAAAAANHELAPLRDAVGARLRAIRATVAGERARERQLSLFDRRAEEAVQQAALAAANIDASLARRLEDVTSPATAQPPRLIALWPVRSR